MASEQVVFCCWIQELTGHWSPRLASKIAMLPMLSYIEKERDRERYEYE